MKTNSSNYAARLNELSRRGLSAARAAETLKNEGYRTSKSKVDREFRSLRGKLRVTSTCPSSRRPRAERAAVTRPITREELEAAIADADANGDHAGVNAAYRALVRLAC
jgi:hypothetical protein